MADAGRRKDTIRHDELPMTIPQVFSENSRAHMHKSVSNTQQDYCQANLSPNGSTIVRIYFILLFIAIETRIFDVGTK
jgi:hypothetical protein